MICILMIISFIVPLSSFSAKVTPPILFPWIRWERIDVPSCLFLNTGPLVHLYLHPPFFIHWLLPSLFFSLRWLLYSPAQSRLHRPAFRLSFSFFRFTHTCLFAFVVFSLLGLAILVRSGSFISLLFVFLFYFIFLFCFFFFSLQLCFYPLDCTSAVGRYSDPQTAW